MSATAHVRWLDREPPDVASLGGKGASLARLHGLGLPTPAGFVVTPSAYRDYLAANALAAREAELRAALPDETARRELERLARDAPLPDPLAGELAGAVARLAPGGEPLAVRSSAALEDGAQRSFAGQHESAIGVAPDRVEECLRGCWASLWSARSVAYRAAHGVAAARGDMAVVVQHAVDAVLSAIAFTRSPVAGTRDDLLVELVEGAGEALASGSASAAAIVLDRATLRPRPGEAPPEGERAAELAELCLRAERHFRCPLDVEAAHDGARWWLLQARPITTDPRSLAARRQGGAREAGAATTTEGGAR